MSVGYNFHYTSSLFNVSGKLRYDVHVLDSQANTSWYMIHDSMSSWQKSNSNCLTCAAGAKDSVGGPTIEVNNNAESVTTSEKLRVEVTMIFIVLKQRSQFVVEMTSDRTAFTTGWRLHGTWHLTSSLHSPTPEAHGYSFMWSRWQSFRISSSPCVILFAISKASFLYIDISRIL